jgi:hypothetical protein
MIMQWIPINAQYVHWIELCGELFPLIEIKYLTQDICSEAMSPLAKPILFK